MTFEISRTIEPKSGIHALFLDWQAQRRGETVQTYIFREGEKLMPLPFSGIDWSMPIGGLLVEAYRSVRNIDRASVSGKELIMVVGRDRESFESF